MALIALATLIIGILLTLSGKRTRIRRGLTDARTLDLDGRTLFSPRLNLAGRPDRVIEENGFQIPEEWKGSPRVYESHIVQLGCYLILIEEETGMRPPHGYISLPGGRHRIENTPELRARVLVIADEIRAMRRQIEQPIPVRQPAAKCRGCGVRESCGQRSG